MTCFSVGEKRRNGVWRRTDWNATERRVDSVRKRDQLLPLSSWRRRRKEGFRRSKWVFAATIVGDTLCGMVREISFKTGPVRN